MNQKCIMRFWIFRRWSDLHPGAKRKTIILVIVYLFFIGVLDYPFAARLYNSYIQGKCITAYEKAAAEADDIQCQRDKAKAYNRSLHTGVVGIKDAFKSTEEGNEEYQSMLSINKDHTMGSLRIPRIDLELPIYHGTSEEVLQKGVGHLEGSSLPVGGRGTHACLSAHRGLPNKRMFTNLDLLEKGDKFYISVLDQVLAYEIYDIRTVLPHEISQLSIRKDKDLVTLITCTPYGINTHRLYVTGKRIPYRKEAKAERVTQVSWWALNWYIPVTVCLLLLLFVLVLIIHRRESDI